MSEHTPLDWPPAQFGGVMAPRPGIGMARWFGERALRAGKRPALSFEGRCWSYAELLDEVERLATVLAAGGVRPGLRVAYLGFNHPMFLVALFAATRLGAIFVPLNFRLTGPELQYILNDAGAHTLLVGGEHVAVIDGVRDALSCRVYGCSDGAPEDRTRWPRLAEAMAAAKRWSQPAPTPAADDVAMIMYTSGTTGRPKGAMLTHGNFWWNHVGEMYTVDVMADDRLLVFAPIFHIGGLNVLTLTTLLKGGHVLLQRHFDPAAALRALQDQQITTLFAVPAMLLFISQQPGFADADLGRLRLIMCGGAPCPAPLLQLYNARGIAIQQGYGLTETAALVSVLTAEHAAAKISSVGHTALLTQIRLIDAEGRELSEPQARGEICVRGPNVTRGYWNNPEATRSAIDDHGWFRTGDVGYCDADGFYYVCDRVKDMIITGGENVYPAEVESVLAGHSAIAEVAVIGAPDEKWGETVVAVVALKPGQSLDLEELQGFAGERLARYKIPRALRLVPALPRNPTGKILKYQLRDAQKA
jgi:fatty-acyl-CoA synthase